LALRKFELTAMGVWPSVVGVTRNTASTVGRGLKDLEASETLRQGRVRRLGDGRKSLGKTDSRLHHDLNAFVEPDARDDPPILCRPCAGRARACAAEPETARAQNQP
jgi:hypothetical protein